MSNRILLITIFIIALATLAKAQEDEIKYDVKVVKEFSADLNHFNKINLEPQLPIFDLNNRKYEYSVKAIPLKLEYDKPQIRPLAFPYDYRKQKYNYFLQLGYGVPKYLKGDLALGYNNKNTDASIWVSHNSANNSGQLKDKRHSYTKIEAQFAKKDMSKEMEYGASVKINNDYNYLYADEENERNTYTTADNKRRLVRGDLGVFFKKENLIPNLTNSSNINYKFLQENIEGEVESNFSINNFSEYQISDYLSANLNLFGSFVNRDNVHLIKAKPSVSYMSYFAKVKLGAEVGKDKSKSFVYPYGELSVNLYQNFIEAFAVVDNKIFNNTDYLKTMENPFIDFKNNDIKPSHYTMIEGGLRSSLEGLKVEVNVGYHILRNKLFYTVSSRDRRTFATIYDDGSNLRFEANASYEILDGLEISGNIVKNFYKMNTLEKAWYNPDFTANADLKYLLFDKKLKIEGSVFFASQMWYLDFDSNREKLSTLFDLSARAKYQFFKNAGLFVEINNIFNQKYRKWYQYPGYGINGVIGVDLRF